jgi:hypothetical protein
VAICKTNAEAMVLGLYRRNGEVGCFESDEDARSWQTCASLRKGPKTHAYRWSKYFYRHDFLEDVDTELYNEAPSEWEIEYANNYSCSLVHCAIEKNRWLNSYSDA